ncbi:ABC transporter ATP-binding protein [Phytopseudomonas dryadis]|uniref:Spermidine/putrescine import ATP-binding protein PotA n=1 Tax=Phytopseudomonas dryadis TaxID=2487520 RepID=A0ABY1ZAM1_9GAMM|nr:MULTISPECIES: ABC transporter ATP-binding protein [Pseudomonas]TBV06441.1 ABC transporter ATP-binding protein [Pseudomonas dryadis]TBV17908.1 ABC transporter ATP-binding protein [Pseudomonas sp. FRB 230]
MSVFTQTTPVVEIRAAIKHYRTPEGQAVRALDGIDLSVGANEFVTLLGPSGCGKTTLLRALSGFEQLDGGDLLIQGRSMNGVPPHKRPVHTVFQSYALFPHMSVGDNVGYALDVRGVGKAEQRQRVAAALELVGLGGLEKRKPGQLSGGQQQRVALARAVVDRPALLLLDEPLSALDRQLRQSMQRELKNLQHELGIAFVFVTHDQEEALTMSDRIVVLNAGHVQQVGAPAAIYDRPANAFVAGFIGESNLFAARVSACDQGIAYLVDEQGDLLQVAADGLQVGQRAQVLLRPEQFHLDCPGGGYAALEGVVEQTVFIGKDFEVLLRSTRGKAVKAVVRDAARQALQRLHPGSALRLWYAHTAAHLIPGGA